MGLLVSSGPAEITMFPALNIDKASAKKGHDFLKNVYRPSKPEGKTEENIRQVFRFKV
jgi:hypothetical protein